MPSQVIFLFDLDQCLPLASSLSSEELERHMSFLKHVCLKILCSASTLDGAENGSADLAHFGFRFYSSTEYFLVSQEVDAAVFYELREDNFSHFENSMSDHFERLWQESKTNTFDSMALMHHLQNSEHKPHAHTLRKALEEIAVLYNWDRPMLHSPVKRDGAKHSDENVVYIFTKLPNSNQELNRFLGSKSIQSKLQHTHIFEEVFNQSSSANSQVKNILNIFKGDANVRVTAVDTSSLFASTQMLDNTIEIFDKRVKLAFHKCLRQFRGGVISVEAFQPDVTKRLRENPPASSIRVSALLAVYISEEHEKRQKPGANKQGSLKIEVDDATLSLNFEPLSENNLESIPPRTLLSLCGLLPEAAFPVSQHYEAHFSVWPSRDQPSWSGLFDRMRRKRQKLLLGFGEDKLGVITPTHDSNAVLSLLSKDDSAFFLIISRLKSVKTSIDEFPENVQIIAAQKVKDQLVNLLKEPSEEKVPVIPFHGSCFETWKVPETKPFGNIVKTLRKREETQKRTTSTLMRELQRAYLPTRVSSLMDKKMGKMSSDIASGDAFARHRSEESIVSHISAKSHSDRGKKTLSRGAELMRLGSKNAELRRHSSEEATIFGGKSISNSAVQNKANSDLLEEKAAIRDKYEKEIIECRKPGEDDDLLFKKLMELQWTLLHQVGDCNAAVAALAEVTVSSMLNFLQEAGRPKTSLEELMEENFLVDPTIVGKRKTSKVQGGRVRDHKLQVLYRIEVHWLLASQEKQTEIEEQILLHLRQISIWDSPEQMNSFLNDVITPSYQIRQPELLCLVYEELNLAPPSCVRELFSPSQRSDCSSIQPSSANSESIRSNPSTAFDLNSRAPATALSKLRRLSSFDSHKLLQINVGAVDKKGAKAAATVNVLMAKRKTGHTPMKKAARRNLTFGGDTMRRSPRKRLLSKNENTAAISSGKNAAKSGIKTPRKNVKMPLKSLKTPIKTPKKGTNKTPKKISPKLTSKSPKKVRQTPRKEDKTPKKKDFATPCKFTPGKSHRILAPETPNLKNGSRRKSDGTLCITESPDVDLIKQTKTTPRRMAASLALHKKKSFYSGNVSRNLIKAEEMLDASRIQNNFVSRNAEPQNVGSLTKRFSDGGAEDMNNSMASFLFPHLLKKRKDSSPEPKPFKISEFVSPSKPVEPWPDNSKIFSPDLSAEADLFEDEPEHQLIGQTPEAKKLSIFKSPDSEEKEVSFASLRKPLRRLFNDEDDELDESVMKVKSATPLVKIPLRVSRTSLKSSSVLETSTSKLETTPVKAETRTLRDRDNTPVKIPFVANFGDVTSMSKTPIKSINQTPVKSCLSSKTPVKTPAQKRGDQNVSFASEDVIFGNRTPVKNNSQIQTSVKYNSQIQTPVKNNSQIKTPVKNKLQIQTPTKKDENVQTPPIKASQTPVKSIELPKSQTPTKNNTSRTPVENNTNQTPVKAPSQQSALAENRLSATGPPQKSMRRRSQREEIRVEKTSIDTLPKTTEHESAIICPDVVTTPGPFERPSRRKNVSVRLGIEDVNLHDVFWSPARKSLSGTPNSKAGTPKQSRSTGSSSQSKNDRKSLLTETETDSDSQPLAVKFAKKSKLAGKPDQHTPAERGLRKLDKRKSLYLPSDIETDSDSQTVSLVSNEVSTEKALKRLREDYRRSLYGISESETDIDSQPEPLIAFEACGGRKLTRSRRSLLSDHVSVSPTVSESSSILNRSKRTRSERDSSIDEVIEVPVEFEEPESFDPKIQNGGKKKKQRKEVIVDDCDDSVFPELEIECREPLLLQIRSTQLSSNIESIASVGGALPKKRSKKSSDQIELPPNTTTIIPFASTTYRHSESSCSTQQDDLNTSLGSQITELSFAQKCGPNYASPSFKKLKKGMLSKSRTPKRLRSGSKKKSSLNSKRSRLQIEFAGSPPIITDTSSLSEVRRRPSHAFENEHVDAHPRSPTPAQGSSKTPPKSPGKFWSIVGTIESPHGEIKMKLNRKKKPSEPANLMIGRISRRMTNDIGMSPTDLMKIISSRSPSPKKRAQFSTEKENSSKFLNESLLRNAISSSSGISNIYEAVDSAPSSVATSENDSPRTQLRKIDNNFFGGASRDASMSSGDRKALKFSPLTSRGLYTLTTSPIVDKKDRDDSIRAKHRKVNKRLYTDEDEK